MNISTNHSDVAMHYEELAKAVFDCDRFGDPWGYADAAIYDANFAPEPNGEAKVVLNTIVDIALWKHREHELLTTFLKEIKGQLKHMKSQDQAISIIHDFIEALNKYID